MNKELVKLLMLAFGGNELASTNDAAPPVTSKDITEDGRYVIVRTYSAGVFAGYIVSRNGREVVLRDARRLWSWRGAAELCQIAISGVSAPTDPATRFSVRVPSVLVTEAIEILACTAEGKAAIEAVPEWTK